jgi:hypothetical protein
VGGVCSEKSCSQSSPSLFSLFFSLLFWFGVFLLSLSPSLFVFLFILVYFSLLVLF